MAVDLFHNEDTSGVLRNDPSASTQRVQAGKYPNVITPGASQPTIYKEILDYFPTRWDLKIADDISSSATYPIDGGSGATLGQLPDQTGVSGNQVKLHASAVPLKGMLVHLTSGSGVGEFAIIDTVGGSNLCTMHRSWTNAPATSDYARLLIPCFLASQGVIKTEFSADDQGITVVLLFYDIGLQMDGTTKRAAIPAADGAHRIRTTGDGATAASQFDVVETSHYHGQVLSIPSFGGVGYKIDVTAAPASGTVSIWAGWV